MRVGINGFGRIGRLALRIASTHPAITWHCINEPGSDSTIAAYLYNYDSVHGRATPMATATETALTIGTQQIPYVSQKGIESHDWAGCDIVLECSGKYRTVESLAGFFAAGVKRVIVAAPISKQAINIVMGVNQQRYDVHTHNVVTAASCTTNCLAPIAHLMHQHIGIRHGMITTMHCMTNTQSVVDKPSKDKRRARAASLNMIPTSTGSASTIGLIIPELNGKLDGIAIRVPMVGASLLDCVFEMQRPTTRDEVNALFHHASTQPAWAHIIGYDDVQLVSTDFRSDTRSAVIDASSTMVTAQTQVKVMAWYDNEMGYAHRYVELLDYVMQQEHTKHG